MAKSIWCSPDEKKIILSLRAEGNSVREIARIMKRSRNMVNNALKPEKLKEKLGRPRKTSSRTDHLIAVKSKMDPWKSSKEIMQETCSNISSRTVRRRLVDANLLGRSARKVPLLSKKNILQRKDFVEKHKNWVGEEGSKKWHNILWSDESKINLHGPDGKSYVRRPKNTALSPKYTMKTVKHGGGNIMIWGCFSWYGVGPIFWIKEKLNQFGYIDILENSMLPYAEENMPLIWTYQQDNDPKHTSKRAKKWFSDKQVDLMSWPAQSPDLNPIENLWKRVKDDIGKIKIKNKQHLWEETQKAWYAIPTQICRTLVESMPRRCAAVSENKGGTTKY